MKTTEAWSAGIFPHLYEWMDHDQIARNRAKWRASVERLGDRWAFIQVQERKPPPEAPKQEPKPLTHVVMDIKRGKP